MSQYIAPHPYKIEYSAIDFTENPMGTQSEATRVAYEEIPPHRTDQTLGDYAIPISPFKTADELAEAMSKLTNQEWEVYPSDWVGDRSYCQGIVSNDELIYIWRDASGGWHPEHLVDRNWLPDLDLLDKLIAASKGNFDAESRPLGVSCPDCGWIDGDHVVGCPNEPACGNVRAEEIKPDLLTLYDEDLAACKRQNEQRSLD